MGFAPGYSPLQYRWGARKLRKQAKSARSRGSVLKVPSKLHPPIVLDDLNGNGRSQIEELSDAPGIYLVTGEGDKALYIGETVSLKKRLSENFRPPQPLGAWMEHGQTRILSIETYVTHSPSSQMMAWQSCLMRKVRYKVQSSGTACHRMSSSLEEAFLAACNGYSEDRVVCDPEFNRRFVSGCRARGLSEPVAVLNKSLLNLRKAGRLTGRRRSRPTRFRDEHRYRFAAEMAGRYLERGRGKVVRLDMV